MMPKTLWGQEFGNASTENVLYGPVHMNPGQ